MDRTKWTSRVFSFDFPEGWIYNILERLYGTQYRIVALVDGLHESNLIHSPGGKWSIKQHIGHLIDLEDLHEGRIDDFLARAPQLRAADMTNAKTHSTNYNEWSIPELVEGFVLKRDRLIYRLKSLDDDTMRFPSLHPRLQVMMRPVDMAYFTAEHDDHHLASIRELVNS
jgi:hypothetical protein